MSIVRVTVRHVLGWISPLMLTIYFQDKNGNNHGKLKDLEVVLYGTKDPPPYLKNSPVDKCNLDVSVEFR